MLVVREALIDNQGLFRVSCLLKLCLHAYDIYLQILHMVNTFHVPVLVISQDEEDVWLGA
jgi:hypothetical protein